MSELDQAALQRALDITKSTVFLKSNAAFLGSLMCSLEFIWDETIETAQTDGVHLWWNPHWFLSLPPRTRETVLVHELWHPGKLHDLRRGARDPKIWNYACDIRINNDLEKEGYSFDQVEWCWKDQSVDANGRLTEEDIYDLLMSNNQQPPSGGGSWGGAGEGESDQGDMVPAPAEALHGCINNVVKAMQQAKLAGAAGSIPGELEQIIDKFLTPIVPWEQHLHEFFTELCDEDFSWARPNRRHLHDDLYLPSMIKDEGKLEHLAYYMDVSGSISDQDVLRFNSGASGTNGTGQSGQGGEGMAAGSSVEMGKYLTEDIYVGVQQGAKQGTTAFVIQLELTPRANLELRTEQQSTKGGLTWKYNY